jgi:hypothetical protein
MRCSSSLIEEKKKVERFLEENRKLFQFYDDHPETEKTWILY